MKSIIKKITVASLYLLLLFFTKESFAQKVGYVDAQGLLERLPEYKDIQNSIDALSKQWKNELEAKRKEIDKLFEAYRTEEPLLTPELKKKKQDEIAAKEKEAKDFFAKKFGSNGELFTQRQEKIKPLQDKLYDAIKAVADERGYDIILDLSGGSNIIYTNNRHNITDAVANKLGTK
ncbi:MAG: OmpH family outer membrane protein [Bacteroidia bacterium]|nr:OmpH family outer membrane protein [Bacteroidia bacterium]MDW8346132.1 OmpH family outer membrane protein [Bacteroidia bacterium]